MHVSKDMLLAELPPYRDEWVMRKKHQQVKDIVKWTIDAYPRFESDYDRIGMFFLGASVAETCENLYTFLIRNVRYVEEGVDWQSIERPAGILIRGFCDCKGYANFIGGCLGAINRMNGYCIDWNFCFASYKIEERTPYHVFIVARDNNGEIFVDPTPGANDMTPVWVINEKIEEPMPLMENVGSLMENVGRVNAAGELYYTPGGVGVTVGTVPYTGIPEADVYIKAINAVLGPLQQQFPRGTLVGDWLSDIGNPAGALQDIAHAIGGYKYTGGDYALGEIFINRVMNKATTSRWDTPDGIVPIAWLYFSTLFGLPIAVNTDFDAIKNGTLSAYLAGRPEQTGYVTQAQVTRANQLFNMLGAQTQTIPQWPPTAFGLLPYAGPIMDARRPGVKFTGTLPNGQEIRDGMPYTAPTTGAGVQVPGSTSTTPTTALGGGNTTTVLILAAAAALIWWASEQE